MSLWSTFNEEGIPDLLLDMRVVQEWPIVPNPCPTDEVRLLGLRQMYAQDYLKFLDRINKLEADFLQWKTAKLRAAQPTVRSEVETVETGECLEVAERWLKERANGGNG